MTHYTAVTIALAWCLGREATYAEWNGNRDLWDCDGVLSAACRADDCDSLVGSSDAHLLKKRATCPRCEVLWDEAVGA